MFKTYKDIFFPTFFLSFFHLFSELPLWYNALRKVMKKRRTDEKVQFQKNPLWRIRQAKRLADVQRRELKGGKNYDLFNEGLRDVFAGVGCEASELGAVELYVAESISEDKDGDYRA